MEWILDQFRDELLDDQTMERVIKKSIVRDGEDLYGFGAEAWADCIWEFIVEESPNFDILTHLIKCNFNHFEPQIETYGGVKGYCQMVYQKRGHLEPFSAEIVKKEGKFICNRQPTEIFEIIREAGEKIANESWDLCDNRGWFKEVWGDVEFI